ncbi:hypothetical protein HY988_00940 [Candidatus Micrarchaeota archaeon]|nr:hypothetical protein [Candidatus Micrarchaeota archaeon]
MDEDSKRFVRNLYGCGEYSLRDLAAMMKVSRSSIWRYVLEVKL